MRFAAWRCRGCGSIWIRTSETGTSAPTRCYACKGEDFDRSTLEDWLKPPVRGIQQ